MSTRSPNAQPAATASMLAILSLTRSCLQTDPLPGVREWVRPARSAHRRGRIRPFAVRSSSPRNEITEQRLQSL